MKNGASSEETYDVPLTPNQRQLLVEGVEIWSGPTRMTDQLAIALGFHDSDSLHLALPEFSLRMRDGAGLTSSDWARVLALTEIAFASNIFGAGRDWTPVTGIEDTETIELLRDVQSHFLGLSIHG